VKKLFASGLFVIVIGIAAFAQDSEKNWYDSYAEGIEQKLFVNAGVGLGYSPYKLGIPPISVSADYKLPIKLPITVGLTGAFRTSTDSYSSGSQAIDMTYTDIGIGARGAYHFNFVKNFDVYAGVTLGYVIQVYDVKFGSMYDNPIYAATKAAYKDKGASYPLFGFNIGGRYFFTQNIGAYLELGYSGIQLASLGLAVKF
jgi:hypothetical protein